MLFRSASVVVVGAREARRAAQAEVHVLHVAVIQERETFSSKKEMVGGEMSEGRILAASPMRRR